MQTQMNKTAAMIKAAFARKLATFMHINRGRDWMPKTATERRAVLRNIMLKHLCK